MLYIRSAKARRSEKMKPQIRTWVILLVAGAIFLLPGAMAVQAAEDGYGDFQNLFIKPGDEAADRDLAKSPAFDMRDNWREAACLGDPRNPASVQLHLGGRLPRQREPDRAEPGGRVRRHDPRLRRRTPPRFRNHLPDRLSAKGPLSGVTVRQPEPNALPGRQGLQNPAFPVFRVFSFLFCFPPQKSCIKKGNAADKYSNDVLRHQHGEERKI